MHYKTIEDRFETIEWTVRASEFLSFDEQQKFMVSFRELWASHDLSVRQQFIQANHENDSILFISEILEKEYARLEFLAPNEPRSGAEKKINVCLNALETLVVNDKNMDMAVDGGGNLVQTLVTILKGVTTRQANQIPASRNFVKFSLRCLTSAIRTEPAVARVRALLLIFFS